MDEQIDSRLAEQQTRRLNDYDKLRRENLELTKASAKGYAILGIVSSAWSILCGSITADELLLEIRDVAEKVYSQIPSVGEQFNRHAGYFPLPLIIEAGLVGASLTFLINAFSERRKVKNLEAELKE